MSSGSVPRGPGHTTSPPGTQCTPSRFVPLGPAHHGPDYSMQSPALNISLHLVWNTFKNVSTCYKYSQAPVATLLTGLFSGILGNWCIFKTVEHNSGLKDPFLDHWNFNITIGPFSCLLDSCYSPCALNKHVWKTKYAQNDNFVYVAPFYWLYSTECWLNSSWQLGGTVQVSCCPRHRGNMPTPLGREIWGAVLFSLQEQATLGDSNYLTLKVRSRDLGQ